MFLCVFFCFYIYCFWILLNLNIDIFEYILYLGLEPCHTCRIVFDEGTRFRSLKLHYKVLFDTFFRPVTFYSIRLKKYLFSRLFITFMNVNLMDSYQLLISQVVRARGIH